MKYLLPSLFAGISLLACNKTVQNAEEMHVNEGHITVVADESFKNIVDAEVNAYMSHYPKTEFDIVYVPEQKAIGLMLSDSAELAIVSRPLTEKEQNYYLSRNIEYQPGKMALDAVTLITSKDVNMESISMAELKSILNGEESEYRLVFDNSSSSNLNLMLETFDIKELHKENIFAATGTEDVFESIQNSKKSIGVIGYNWISDEDYKPAMALREKVNVLGIKTDDGETIYPNSQSLRNQSYPLIKTVYLHTTQHRWGVAKGFVRFACSQIGQLVVEKMGLQPYYLIPKRYEMFDTPELSTVE